MTEKRFSIKALIALLLAMVLLSCFGVASSAADSFKNLKGAYGYIVPTDVNLKAQKKSYSFYGDSGKIYFMRISKGKKNAKFAVEIYSDENMSHKIRNLNDSFDAKAGNKALSVSWNFKDVKSGKYYGRCYAYYEDADGEKVIDSSSLEAFTININRVGKKTVKITKVKNTSSGVTVSWQSLPTAEKYMVYRKVVGAKSWAKIATVGADKTSYTDTKANSGNRYTYTVKCYDGKYNSLYNKSGVSIVYLSSPKLKAVEGSSSAGYAKVSWNKVTGATGYRVYRKGGNLSDFEWKLIAIVKGNKTTSYIDKKATSTDWNYTYTVKAFNSTSYSAHNTTGVDFDYIGAPSLKKAYPYDTGMRIEWSNKNENVEKYYVYRKSGNSWKKIGETRKTYFIDTKAASGSTYTYTVKALSDTNAGAYSSKGISAKFIATPDVQDITFNSKNQSVVKWSKVKSAVGYKVYRKVNDASKWSLIKTVVGNSNTTFYDTVKKNSGDSFTYTVRAYDNKGRTGYFTIKGKTGTFLSVPVVTANQLFTEDGSLAIEIAWDSVKGADSYHVYRKLPDGAWEYLAKNVTENTFTDTTVANGQVYDYTVRAITDEGDMSKYSPVSAYATTIPVLESVNVIPEGVKVSWLPAEGATGYAIYKAPKDGGDYIKAGEVAVAEGTPCEFTDTNPSALENAYFYAVSAIVNTVEGAKSNIIGNFVEINATAQFNAENVSIDLSWDATENTIVSIQKAVNDEPALPLVDSLQSTNSYIDAFIEEGSTYTYTITASQDGKLSASSVVSAKYPHPPLSATTIVSLAKEESTDDASCVITWTSVEFADEYVVLRAEIDGEEYGEYEEIATVSKADADENGMLSFTDADVPADGKYSYVIKAIATESERDSSVSEEKVIEVYKQLSGVADLKYTSAKTENGFEVTLSWAPTELSEKYVIIRTTVATKKTVTLGEILPEAQIEGADPILKTYFVDDSPEADVKYIYRVSASAENRGTVYNEAEFCFGIPKAYYTDFKNEKANVEALLGNSNLDENGKEKYVQEVYDQVKLSFDETVSNLSLDLSEEEQAIVDTATADLIAFKEMLANNAYYTVIFKDIDGVTLTEATVITGTLFSDIEKPELTSTDDLTAYVGWADESNKLVANDYAIETSSVFSPAKEEVKLILKEDAAISFTDEGYINGISYETTVEAVKAQLGNDLTYIVVKNHLGEELEDTAFIGTGATLSLVSKYTDTVYESKTVVISADLDGNGVLNESDYEIASSAAVNLAETYTFNGVYIKAFEIANDVAADGVIDSLDALMVSTLIGKSAN